MICMAQRNVADDTPLVKYAQGNIWGNPEENGQFQVKLVRLTADGGVTVNFPYMGRWRALPREKRAFHIFSVGGLSPGYWNFNNEILNRNPLDRWINIGRLARKRGLQLDLYNAKGSMYSRSHAWVMKTYDGLTLIAFEKFQQYPIPYTQDMWFRCYNPTGGVDKWETSLDANNPYVYETLVHSTSIDMNAFMSMYQRWKAKPGYTGVFHNGAYFEGAPNTIPGLAAGDIVEFWHDPTVIRTEKYKYSQLLDFYSAMDKKRKLILHPPKVKGDFTIRYFDDNDYYLTGKNKRGLLYPRNDVTAVRQLTHVDVALADEFLQNATTYHPDLAKLADMYITVLVRKTSWIYKWPNEHQRIRYLYRLNDVGIIRAMTGVKSTIPEWSAPGLEAGSVMSFTRLQWNDITRPKANLAIGYNAATRVLSETPLRAEYKLGSMGIEVPVSYQGGYTAWEYDNKGLLIGYHNVAGSQFYSPVHPTCVMVEFTLGSYGREFDITVTNLDTAVDRNFDLRVYTCGWNIDLNQIVGEWVDVTGKTDVYTINDGVLAWKGLDRVNQRGILVTNKKSVAYTFNLNHLDHSLSFALTDVYVGGGKIFPYSPAEVDVWLNKHSLIEKVDWIWKNQRVYIVNKEFIVDGAQEITIRAHSFRDNLVRPNSDTELGFVDGGVIGRVDRYNLRGDRVTRTVIGGSLYMTDEVPRAERLVPDNQWTDLNGLPYCVKHIYCPVRFVEDYQSFPMRQRSRELDQKISDYLTVNLPKPATLAEEIRYEKGDETQPVGSGKPAIPTLQDKYRVFSPFLSVITNGILNRFITLPAFEEGETTFSDQQVRDLVKNYIWWLEFDPVILNYDRRYFAIMPYANFNIPTVTPREFIFIKKVNDLFLDSVCSIEGHYEVNANVR